MQTLGLLEYPLEIHLFPKAGNQGRQIKKPNEARVVVVPRQMQNQQKQMPCRVWRSETIVLRRVGTIVVAIQQIEHRICRFPSRIPNFNFPPIKCGENTAGSARSANNTFMIAVLVNFGAQRLQEIKDVCPRAGAQIQVRESSNTWIGVRLLRKDRALEVNNRNVVFSGCGENFSARVSGLFAVEHITEVSRLGQFS